MKPIIFSAPMVQAILDGKKTQTRRVIKPQPKLIGMTGWPKPILHIPGKGPLFPACEDESIVDVRWRFAPYRPGEVLWVRETWKSQDYQFIDGVWSAAIVYKAGGLDHRVFWEDGADNPYERCGQWRPSIFMPRAAARIFLRVKDVRVERVQGINEADARAEGVDAYENVDHHRYLLEYPHVHAFSNLWDRINAKRGYGWEENPFVWVIEFERIEAADANK